MLKVFCEVLSEICVSDCSGSAEKELYLSDSVCREDIHRMGVFLFFLFLMCLFCDICLQWLVKGQSSVCDH